jgi:hypothetical protein
MNLSSNTTRAEIIPESFVFVEVKGEAPILIEWSELSEKDRIAMQSINKQCYSILKDLVKEVSELSN